MVILKASHCNNTGDLETLVLHSILRSLQESGLQSKEEVRVIITQI
jgi:hypothetical protein